MPVTKLVIIGGRSKILKLRLRLGLEPAQNFKVKRDSLVTINLKEFMWIELLGTCVDFIAGITSL
jgi:hypothetical protein